VVLGVGCCVCVGVGVVIKVTTLLLFY